MQKGGAEYLRGLPLRALAARLADNTAVSCNRALASLTGNVAHRQMRFSQGVATDAVKDVETRTSGAWG